MNSVTRSPATITSDASIGTVAWTNPTRVAASDNQRATADLASGNISQYLKCTNYGFTFTSSDVVFGILPQVEKRDSTTSGSIFDYRARLVKAGAIQSTDKASSAEWPNNDTLVDYGGEADLWGGTWAYTDINNSGFGFALSAQRIGGILTAQAAVDWVPITVYYATVKLVAETVSISDAAAKSVLVLKSVAESVSISDAAVALLIKQVAETLSMADATAAYKLKVVAEQLQLGEVSARYAMHQLTYLKNPKVSILLDFGD